MQTGVVEKGCMTIGSGGQRPDEAVTGRGLRHALPMTTGRNSDEVLRMIAHCS
jgi:hypothetical protein